MNGVFLDDKDILGLYLKKKTTKCEKVEKSIKQTFFFRVVNDILMHTQ